MANSSDYTVPFGIDASQFFSELNKMDSGMDALGEAATAAATNMQKAFTTAAQSSDKLTTSINADAAAVQLLRDGAAKAGVDIANSLSGKGLDTAFNARVDAIRNKLKTLTTTAVDVDVNFDDSKIILLENQIKEATSATGEFNAVIQFAKDQLAQLQPGGQGFITLSNQIATAEDFVNKLNVATAQLIPTANSAQEAFHNIFADPGAFLNQKELQALDQELSISTTDAEALGAEVSALQTKLSTLKPDNVLFDQFTQAVNAGTAALRELEATSQQVNEIVPPTVTGVGTPATPVTPSAVTSNPGNESEQAQQVVEANTQIAASETVAETATVSYRTQLRLLREQLADLYAQGLQNTQEFQDLTAEAARVGNAIKNASATIKELSGNTVYLNAGVQAVNALGGAFIAASAGVAIFSDDNQKAQQIVTKVYAGIAALNGIQQLANAFQKDSLLSLLLLNSARQQSVATTTAQVAATTAEATAEEAEAVAITETATATEGATVATEGFTAALLLNPITLIIAAIVLATVAIIEYSKGVLSGADYLERLNNQLDLSKQNFADQEENIKRLSDVRTSYANLDGAKQSELTAITVTGLTSQLSAQQKYSDSILQGYAKNDQLRHAELISVDEYYKQEAVLDKQYSDSRSKERDLQAQIDLDSNTQKKQANDEAYQLDSQLLAEQNSNFSANKQLQSQMLAYIKDAHRQEEDELTQNNDKQIQKIKDAGQDRIDAVLQNIADLKEKSKENTAQISNINLGVSVGDVDPTLAAKQISDLQQQNANISKVVKDGQADIKAIQNATGLEIYEAQKDFAQKRLDLLLSANIQIAQSEETGFQRDQDVAQAQYQQKLQQIQQQYKGQNALIAQLMVAATAEYANNQIKATTANNLKIIDQDKQLELDRIAIIEAGDIDNLQNQDKYNIQKLNVQIQAAEDSRAQLVEDDSLESALVLGDADALIAALKAKKKAAVAKAGTDSDLFSILGINGLSDDEKKGLNDALTDVTKATKQITDALVSGYQEQITAKQAKIDSDNNDLSTLESQLQTEENLQKQGLANNVSAIQAQILAKNNQIKTEEDQQNKLIKQRQAAQRAQAAINALEEAGSLTVAAAHIYEELSPLGPVGVGLAVASIAVMIAGFAAAQIAVFKAINANNSASGTLAEGGKIGGRSHNEGGQKYRSIDGTGEVLELEAGEFVVRNKVTKKHESFLEALNNEQLTDDHLREFLLDMGIHLISDTPKSAIKDTVAHSEAKMNFTIKNSGGISPEDLLSLKADLKYLADRKKEEPTTWDDGSTIHIIDKGVHKMFKK